MRAARREQVQPDLFLHLRQTVVNAWSRRRRGGTRRKRRESKESTLQGNTALRNQSTANTQLITRPARSRPVSNWLFQCCPKPIRSAKRFGFRVVYRSPP